MNDTSPALDESTSNAHQNEALACSAGITTPALGRRVNDPFELDEVTHRRWRRANPVRVAHSN